MSVWVIDTETTGIDPASDRVVEFAAVPVHIAMVGDRVLGTLEEGASSLVYPGIAIPPKASAVHHLIDEDVENAPPLGRAINQVLGPLWQAAPDPIFVAHNARFDRSFLHPLHDARWIDTYRCARHLMPTAPGFSNQCLRYWLKLPIPRDLPVHRALGDAVVTAHLFVRLLLDASPDELLRLSKKAVLLTHVPFGKHREELWSSVPDSYLSWLAGQKSDDPDVRWTLKKEIERRKSLSHA